MFLCKAFPMVFKESFQGCKWLDVMLKPELCVRRQLVDMIYDPDCAVRRDIWK